MLKHTRVQAMSASGGGHKQNSLSGQRSGIDCIDRIGRFIIGHASGQPQLADLLWGQACPLRPGLIIGAMESYPVKR